MNRTHSFAALCFAVLAPAVHATPDVLGYAARVENDAGPFNGTVSASFELFAAPTGGNSIFEEDIASLIVVEGTMVHDIGSEQPLDDSVLQRDDLFLQVTLNGEVLQPRVALRAVPYALHAREADSLQGLSADDVVTQPQLSAFRPRFQDLQNIPAGLLDGDQDTLFTPAPNGGLSLSGTAFAVAPNGINASRLADNAVESRHYVDGSIQATHIAPGTITAAQLAAGAVGAGQLQANAVNSLTIVNGSVTDADLATEAVTNSKLANESISAQKIRTGAVGSTQIADGSIQPVDFRNRLELFRTNSQCGALVVTTEPTCQGGFVTFSNVSIGFLVR